MGTPEGLMTYGYDHRGRPASVTDPRIGTTTYAFDADDRLASALRDNGLQTTYAYTTAGRVERITVLDNGSTVDESLFQYDLRGQVTSVTDAFGQHDYGYDTAGQLTSADHPVASGLDDESYTYDLLGNRTEWDGHPPAAVAYDTEGRLVQDAENSYAFDAEGNLTEHVDLGSAHLTEYHWNSFGELVRIVHPDGTESTFAYDGLGRRVEAVDRGTPTRFGWDGGELRMQFDDNNQLTRWIGTGAFAEPLAEYDAATGLVEDVLTDKMGSTTGTWDGTSVTRSPRDSFGNLPGNAAPTDFQHHALTWHTQDPTGLIYARARYLDPKTGRFLSEDPVVHGNLYTYAENSPTGTWDPLGLNTASEYGIHTADDSLHVQVTREVGEEIACILFIQAAGVIAPPGAGVVLEVACDVMTSPGRPRPGKPPKPCFSFAEDTPIHAADGLTPIQDIQQGDRVISVPSELATEPVAIEPGTPERSEPALGLQHYDPRTGAWSLARTLPTEVGDEFLEGGQLYRVTASGPVSIGTASWSALSRADATWTPDQPTEAPQGTDLVLVFSDDGLHHARLQALEPGVTIAFDGRLFEVGEGVLYPTGQVLGRVVDAFTREADTLLDASFALADGRITTLSATPEHPFYVNGRWTGIWRLEPGDVVDTEDGQGAVLLELTERAGPLQVFNFQVEGEHSYLVGAGDGLRAHNANNCTPNPTCFVAGTGVTTPTDKTPIESIEIGDLVQARGEAPADSDWHVPSGKRGEPIDAKDRSPSKLTRWARRAVAAGCVAGACQAMAYDATTGIWEDSAFSIAVDAEELLGPDGHLYRVTDSGMVDRGVVDDFEALVAAAVPIDESWDDGTPEWQDWVLVIGAGEAAGHHRLLEVAAGDRFAWQGRVFDTRVGSEGQWEVRDSGQVLARVTETFKRMAVDEVIDLEVAYPDGSVEVLTGTYEHPFWVEAEQAWVKLGELAAGDVLTTDGGGETVVVGLMVRPGSHEVFNIEVAGPHNYFVRADGSDGPGVLVHNKKGGGDPPCDVTNAIFDIMWGVDRPNHSKPKRFKNREGRLPGKTSCGCPITYTEYDVNPSRNPRRQRDARRIVIGSDGSIFWTIDHYASFTCWGR